MSDGSASPEELHDEEQVDIDGAIDLDEDVDDASADIEDEEFDEDDKTQGLDLDVPDDEEHSGFQDDQDQDADVLNGEHHMAAESPAADEDVPISIDDTKDEFKDDTEGEKSGELLKRPPHGSEIFVGGITRDTTEEDLRNLCSCCGDIYEVGFFC
jgi:heterogeneous nuclear ribonucleoprotein R